MWKLSWALVLLLVWIFVGAGAGWIVAEVIHEHGSIIWFFVGIFLGVVGGLCNVLYFLVRQRKSQTVASAGI